MVDITDIHSSNLPKDCLVLVSAPWCAPCDVAEKLLKEKEIDAEIYKINTDNDTNFCQSVMANNIPQLMRIKDRVVESRLIGTLDICNSPSSFFS